MMNEILFTINSKKFDCIDQKRMNMKKKLTFSLFKSHNSSLTYTQ